MKIPEWLAELINDSAEYSMEELEAICEGEEK